MLMRDNGRNRWRALASALLVVVGGVGLAQAQLQPQPQGKQDAPVVVDGIVREVYKSPRQTNTDYVVQIEVQGAQLGKAPQERLRLGIPVPGDDVYVHVFQPREGAPRNAAAGGHRAIPTEGSTIRAYLYPRAQGGWGGAYPDWFDANNNIRAAAEEV